MLEGSKEMKKEFLFLFLFFLFYFFEIKSVMGGA